MCTVSSPATKGTAVSRQGVHFNHGAIREKRVRHLSKVDAHRDSGESRQAASILHGATVPKLSNLAPGLRDAFRTVQQTGECLQIDGFGDDDIRASGEVRDGLL